MSRLKEIHIFNFKSYADAVLPLAPVTLLVGANASGKSNALEALQMLSWLAKGRRLDDVFRAVQESEVILRGTVKDLTKNDEEFFHLGCLIDSALWTFLGIGVEVATDTLRIRHERISDGAVGGWLYNVSEQKDNHAGSINVTYDNFKRGGNKPSIACTDQQAVFTQLISPARFGAHHVRSQKEIPAACNAFIKALESIIFLDPQPQRMREPSFPQDKVFRGDGSNLSSVLHRICMTADGKASVLAFIRALPEQDITDIGFLDYPRGEVLVQLEENFGNIKNWRDAGVLSDGTLRVLSVAAALLSAPEGSTVVIEEIDNGVHPSRAGTLLSAIDKIARERNLSILITSHNPALLDAIPNRALPDVVFCYRDPDEGDSRLVRLQDLPNYPELVSRGPLGRLVTQGILDRMAKHPVSPEDKMAAGLSYVEQLKQSES
jgi:predicted ATPase